MELPRDAVLLRIFIGEDTRFDHRPLYEAIVTTAREQHLAGATVLRGPMGYGHSSELHTTKILNLAENLPVVNEIVDTQREDRPVSAGVERDDVERPRDARKSSGASIRKADFGWISNTMGIGHAGSPRRRPASDLCG